MKLNWYAEIKNSVSRAGSNYHSMVLVEPEADQERGTPSKQMRWIEAHGTNSRELLEHISSVMREPIDSPANLTRNLTTDQLAAVIKTRLDGDDRQAMLSSMMMLMSMDDLDALKALLP